MEGKGRMISSNGDVYDGDWVEGVMSGEGTFNYANG